LRTLLPPGNVTERCESILRCGAGFVRGSRIPLRETPP
jgi:hypothetical protein